MERDPRHGSTEIFQVGDTAKTTYLTEDYDLEMRDLGIGSIWNVECDENFFRLNIVWLETLWRNVLASRAEDIAADLARDDGRGEGASRSTLARDQNRGHMCEAVGGQKDVKGRF